MKKSDLRNGDIVKTREGNKYIVLLNAGLYKGGTEDLLINLMDGCYLRLSGYKEDLTWYDEEAKNFDIVSICAFDYVGDNLRQHGLTQVTAGYKWTWKRTEAKKMTVSEICKELGYDIEIVKED